MKNLAALVMQQVKFQQCAMEEVLVQVATSVHVDLATVEVNVKLLPVKHHNALVLVL